MAMRSEYWSRRAYAPNHVKRPNNPDLRGKFVVKGLKREMDRLWRSVNAATADGQLGYFANISDDSDVLIVYHSNADNRREKSAIEKKLNELMSKFGVTVDHRRADEDFVDYSYGYNSDSDSEIDSQANSCEDTRSEDTDEDIVDEEADHSLESSSEDSEQSDEESTEDSSEDSNESESNSGYESEVVIEEIVKRTTIKRKRNPNKRMTRSELKRSGKRLKI